MLILRITNHRSGNENLQSLAWKISKNMGNPLRARVASYQKIIQWQPKTRSWRFYDQTAISEHYCERVTLFTPASLDLYLEKDEEHRLSKLDIN